MSVQLQCNVRSTSLSFCQLRFKLTPPMPKSHNKMPASEESWQDDLLPSDFEGPPSPEQEARRDSEANRLFSQRLTNMKQDKVDCKMLPTTNEGNYLQQIASGSTDQEDHLRPAEECPSCSEFNRWLQHDYAWESSSFGEPTNRLSASVQHQPPNLISWCECRDTAGERPFTPEPIPFTPEPELDVPQQTTTEEQPNRVVTVYNGIQNRWFQLPILTHNQIVRESGGVHHQAAHMASPTRPGKW